MVEHVKRNERRSGLARTPKPRSRTHVERHTPRPEVPGRRRAGVVGTDREIQTARLLDSGEVRRAPGRRRRYFQAVWLELFGALPRVRDSGALRGWLVTVTTHLTFHWRVKRRRAEQTLTDLDDLHASTEAPLPAGPIGELER